MSKSKPKPPSIRILKNGYPICVKCMKGRNIKNTRDQLCVNCDHGELK
jgi:hypothetical protein